MDYENNTDYYSTTEKSISSHNTTGYYTTGYYTTMYPTVETTTAAKKNDTSPAVPETTYDRREFLAKMSYHIDAYLTHGINEDFSCEALFIQELIKDSDTTCEEKFFEIWVPCQSRHSFWNDLDLPFEIVQNGMLKNLCDSEPSDYKDKWYESEFGKKILHIVGKMIVDMIWEDKPWWGVDYVREEVIDEYYGYSYWEYREVFGFGFTPEMLYELGAKQYMMLERVADTECMEEVHQVSENSCGQLLSVIFECFQ